MPLFEIDFKLFPMKLHYFLWNAGTAPIVPFVPTIAKQLGFSTVIVGTIYTFLPIFGLLAKPIFGAISDRFKVQKLLFLSFIIWTAIMFYAILYIPTIELESKVQLECGVGESHFKYCSGDLGVNKNCLQKKFIPETQNNISYVCEVNCQTKNKKFLASLCEQWKVPQFCSQTTQPVNFQNSVSSIVSHDISKKFDPSQIGKYDIHGKAKRAVEDLSLSTQGYTEVGFVSQISSYHIVKIESCLYFPIKHVHFKSENKTIEHFPLCKVPIDVESCKVSCDSPDIMAYLENSQVTNVTTNYQFWLLFIFLSSSWVGMAVVVSLGDTICFELLGNEPQKYGKQRLWGSIGWGTFSIIAGFLVDHFSSSSHNKNYTPVFYLMLALLLFDFFVSSKVKNVQSSISPSLFRDVSKLLVEPRVVAFLFWCISVGVCTSMIWQYLFWFLEDLSSAQGCDYNTWIKTLQGLAMAVQCFGGELPFFFLSGWFIRKLGHVNSMTIVLLGFALRFYLYSILTDPWWTLPIELLNGITFGLFWPCMASYANIIAPPGTEATIQGLVGAVFEGVGVSLGSFSGGYIYSSFGGVNTFRIFSLAALLFSIIHYASHYFLKFKARYGMDDTVKEANPITRYASPTEAIHMLEDVTS